MCSSDLSSQKADMLGAERDALRQKCEADVMKFAQALPNLNQLNPNNPNSPAHDPSTPISAVPKLPLTQNRFVPTAPATSSAINTPVTVAAGATDSFITMTSVQIKGNALEACLKSSGGSTTKSLSLRFETSNTEKLNLSPSWVTLGNEGHVVVANSTSCVRFDLPPHTNSQCKIFRVAIESGLSSKDSNQRNHVREIKTVCQ